MKINIYVKKTTYGRDERQEANRIFSNVMNELEIENRKFRLVNINEEVEAEVTL